MGYDDGRAGIRADRTMDAEVNRQDMSPTPVQPHLAHCCSCNAAEITEAAVRQRFAESAQNERQRQGDAAHILTNLISSAASMSNEVGTAAEAAKDFLEAMFKAEQRKAEAGSFTLPRM